MTYFRKPQVSENPSIRTRRAKPMIELSCGYCGKLFIRPHALRIYCEKTCTLAANRKMRIENYAAGRETRRIKGARFFPAKCSVCGDIFQPTGGHDSLCVLCKQKRERWTENVVSSLLRSAKIRKGSAGFDLTRTWFEETWTKQDGRCAISGVAMTRVRQSGSGNIWGQDGTKVSLDRINHDGPYSMANTRLVCVIVNLMRHRMTDDQLLQWCERIIANHRDERGEPACDPDLARRVDLWREPESGK
jgi:ribosomal protein S27E